MFRHPFDMVVQRMDFSQIEAQCATHYAAHYVAANARSAGDESTLARDIHTEFASEMFGVPEENITPNMRKMAKECLFGRLYGGS